MSTIRLYPTIIDSILISIPGYADMYGYEISVKNTCKKFKEKDAEEMLKSLYSLKPFLNMDIEALPNECIFDKTLAETFKKDIKDFGIVIEDKEYYNIFFVFNIVKNIVGNKFIIKKITSNKILQAKRVQPSDIDIFLPFIQADEDYLGTKNKVIENIKNLEQILKKAKFKDYNVRIIRNIITEPIIIIDNEEDLKELLEFILKGQREKLEDINLLELKYKKEGEIIKELKSDNDMSLPNIAWMIYSYVKTTSLSPSNQFILTGYMMVHLGCMYELKEWVKYKEETINKQERYIEKEIKSFENIDKEIKLIGKKENLAITLYKEYLDKNTAQMIKRYKRKTSPTFNS